MKEIVKFQNPIHKVSNFMNAIEKITYKGGRYATKVRLKFSNSSNKSGSSLYILHYLRSYALSQKNYLPQHFSNNLDGSKTPWLLFGLYVVISCSFSWQIFRLSSPILSLIEPSISLVQLQLFLSCGLSTGVLTFSPSLIGFLANFWKLGCNTPWPYNSCILHVC